MIKKSLETEVDGSFKFHFNSFRLILKTACSNTSKKLIEMNRNKTLKNVAEVDLTKVTLNLKLAH
jgi:hypothetical protein